MDVDLREVTDLTEALGHAPELDRYAEETLDEFRDEPLPPGVCARFFERKFDARETLFLVAESEPGRADLGMLLVGPFEDPLVGEAIPMVLVLHVDSEVRHRGLARALVNEATRILIGRGMTSLAARAGHNDDALISMGERWGFLRLWELMVLE